MEVEECIESLEVLIQAMRLDEKLGRVKCGGTFLEDRIAILQNAIETIQNLQKGAKS